MVQTQCNPETILSVPKKNIFSWSSSIFAGSLRPEHISVNHLGHNRPTPWRNCWPEIGRQWHWLTHNIHWRRLHDHHTLRTRLLAQCLPKHGLDAPLKWFHGHTRHKHCSVTATHKQRRRSDVDRQMTPCTWTFQQMTDTYSVNRCTSHATVWSTTRTPHLFFQALVPIKNRTQMTQDLYTRDVT